jgi:hypothetical protein
MDPDWLDAAHVDHVLSHRINLEVLRAGDGHVPASE